LTLGARDAHTGESRLTREVPTPPP